MQEDLEVGIDYGKGIITKKELLLQNFIIMDKER